jgi:CelD/BcsL family acetyltransferase involved in cellulose biosynthesis
MVLGKAPVYLFVYRHDGVSHSCCLLTLCPARRKKNLVSTLQLQINEYLAPGLDMIKAYNGLLSRKGSEQNAWRMFFQAAKRFNKQWDEILLSSLLPADVERVSNVDHGLAVDTEKTAFGWIKDLNLPDATGEALLHTCKKKSKKQLKQSLSAFAELCNIHFDAAADRATAIEFFEQMRDLHTQRWQAAGEDGSFANPHWTDFHTRMINNFFDDGLILMFKVSCGDLVLGYLYGHYYRNRVYMQQTGFVLMDDNKLRPGYVSHFEAMRYCAGMGALSYDLLPDSVQSYKKFFVAPEPPISRILVKRPRFVFLIEILVDYLKQLTRSKNAVSATTQSSNGVD